MCEAVTNFFKANAGSISTGLQVAGAVSGAFGSYQQAKSAQAVAANNAKLAEWQAQDAITRGQRSEQAQRMKVAQLKGSQRASMAARGLDLGEGSALSILQDTDYMGEVDATTIRDNATREAWAYRNQAAQYKSQADSMSPFGSAFGTLLTGAGSVADSWYRRNSAGAR